MRQLATERSGTAQQVTGAIGEHRVRARHARLLERMEFGELAPGPFHVPVRDAVLELACCGTRSLHANTVVLQRVKPQVADRSQRAEPLPQSVYEIPVSEVKHGLGNLIVYSRKPDREAGRSR